MRERFNTFIFLENTSREIKTYNQNVNKSRKIKKWQAASIVVTQKNILTINSNSSPKKSKDVNVNRINYNS